ncbi:MAG: hypothetical protein ACT4NY_02990 [Pseudonocardiales bacterium]
MAAAVDPLIERIITERGNALLSLTLAKPIRVEFLPLGRFVTFDRSVALSAVPGATPEHLTVP